jgi:hypothetical protein
MRRMIALFAATTMSLAPAVALAQTAQPQSPASGSISPAHATGQPGLECQDGGVRPGTQSGRDPGPGAPFQADSVSGSHYAGEQAGINDKNTASVSQYDVACFRPQH